MKINTEALALLKSFEGISLVAYKDAAGIDSIGYGHTRDVKPGMFISRSKAENFLIEDYLIASEGVERHVQVPLNEYQHAALTCLVFNIGEGNFARSTLLKRLNDRRYDDAADQFLRWVYAGNKALPGLARRRAAERALFLKTPAREAPNGTEEPLLGIG